jgi:hypothetical protein
LIVKATPSSQRIAEARSDRHNNSRLCHGQFPNVIVANESAKKTSVSGYLGARDMKTMDEVKPMASPKPRSEAFAGCIRKQGQSVA